jgi:D-xylose transport system ATP-binding protein
MTSVAATSAPGNEPIIALRGIRKHYGSVVALDGVDFDIWPSEVHSLVGDNGAGKSTLVKVIAGAHQSDDGALFVDGAETEIGTPERAARLGIATVYQNLAIVNTRSVAQNVFMGREPTRWLMVDRRRMERESAQAIKALGVANLPSVHAEVGRLSGGQRQAVAIARAIQEGNRVLILDEPTAALGVRESHHVLDLIERLKAQGLSIVLVSHNLLHVFRVTDRITVLRAGKIVGSRMKSDTNPEEIVAMITGAHML